MLLTAAFVDRTMPTGLHFYNVGYDCASEGLSSKYLRQGTTFIKLITVVEIANIFFGIIVVHVWLEIK